MLAVSLLVHVALLSLMPAVNIFPPLEIPFSEQYIEVEGILIDAEALDEQLEEGMEKIGKVRDQGFRKAIVELYEHRCSLCGIRMRTPEGHTVVVAAHIKPWSKSHDDRPTNGMALCRLCHWYFDEGLMGVGKKYEVLVSNRIQVQHNLPGHILTLRDRNIFTPNEEKHWPTQNNLNYHRQKTFRL